MIFFRLYSLIHCEVQIAINRHHDLFYIIFMYNTNACKFSGNLVSDFDYYPFRNIFYIRFLM